MYLPCFFSRRHGERSPSSLTTNSKSCAHPTPSQHLLALYPSLLLVWLLCGFLLSPHCVTCSDPLCLLLQPSFCSFSIPYLTHSHPSPASRKPWKNKSHHIALHKYHQWAIMAKYLSLLRLDDENKGVYYYHYTCVGLKLFIIKQILNGPPVISG